MVAALTLEIESIVAAVAEKEPLQKGASAPLGAGLLEGGVVARSAAKRNIQEGIPGLSQKDVNRQAPDPAIPVAEGVDVLEPEVELPGTLDRMHAGAVATRPTK